MVTRPVFVPLGEVVDQVFGSAGDWVGDNRTLSDRLWLARKADRDAIDTILRTGLATGADPLQVAKLLEDYLTPVAELARFPEGHKRAGQVKPFSQQPKGVATRTPRSGMGNYAARRLARTETSRAFNEGVRQSAALNPFVDGVRWNLSASSHTKQDICDEHAEGHSAGFPPGVYRIDEAPTMPSHPHCRCWWSQYSAASTDDVVSQLRRDIETPDNIVPFVRPPRSAPWNKIVALLRAAKALVTGEAA